MMSNDIFVFVCVQVWAVDLLKNEKVVKDVILVAQGEMALEEFLKMVRKLQYLKEADY